MGEDREAIARMYADYFEAFQSLDPEVVLHYYHRPFMVLSSAGVLALAGAAEARALFAEMMKGLRARGYARSEKAGLGLQQLSESAAVLSARVVRYRTDGAELERFGATYTLRKTDSGWKIVMLTIHDFDAVLELP